MHRYSLTVEFETKEQLGRQRPTANMALCEGIQKALELKDAVFTHMSLVEEKPRWTHEALLSQGGMK